MPSLLKYPTVTHTADPGATDDISKGYLAGQLWFNTISADLFQCKSPAAGAAVWQKQNGAAGAVSSVNTRTGAVVLTATDIPTMVASGASHAGGTVPDPGASAGTTRALFEDGTWKVPSGGGGGVLLQRKNVSSNSQFTTASASFVDTGLTAVLASVLQNASNIVRVRYVLTANCSALASVSFTIKRGNTTDLTPGGANALGVTVIPGSDYCNQVVIELYDAPGTTTPASYNLWMKTNAGTAGIGGRVAAGFLCPTCITLEELTP